MPNTYLTENYVEGGQLYRASVLWEGSTDPEYMEYTSVTIPGTGEATSNSKPTNERNLNTIAQDATINNFTLTLLGSLKKQLDLIKRTQPGGVNKGTLTFTSKDGSETMVYAIKVASVGDMSVDVTGTAGEFDINFGVTSVPTLTTT